MFSCEFWEIFKNTLFNRKPLVDAFENTAQIFSQKKTIKKCSEIT